MDLAETLKNPSAPAPGPTPKLPENDTDVIEFSEKGTFNFPLFVLWMAAVAATAGAVFFWFLNNSAKQDLADITAEKDLVVSEIVSPTYADIESRATAFKSAVSALKSATTESYSVSHFLPLFYGRINKNVELSNVTVSADGKVSFDGTTDSYRSAALQSVTLKEWKINNKNVLTDVELVSASEKIEGGTVTVSFAISAAIDKSVSLTESTATGGQNAQIQ